MPVAAIAIFWGDKPLMGNLIPDGAASAPEEGGLKKETELKFHP